MQATIKPTRTLRFVLRHSAAANLAGSVNPIQVSLIIGNDSGTMSFNAVATKVATK